MLECLPLIGIGASFPLPCTFAKVCRPNRQLPLKVGGGNRSSCPIAVIERKQAGGLSHSNALWAAFDNTESRLGGRMRHVVGHYRLGEALESEWAKLFSCDASH